MSDPRHEELIDDRIEREVVLDASPDEVWDVITGPEWLAEEVRLDLVPGGEAEFRSADGERSGWIEEARPPEGDGANGRLVFWWSADGEPASRVEVTLEPVGSGGTRLRVVEARPLEVLDLVGMPLPGMGGSTPGPLLLAGVA